jgi:hypothetical protein
MSTLTNLLPIESFTREEYDASLNRSRELWILVHENGFCYCIADTYQKQVMAFNAFEVTGLFQVSRQTWKGFLDGLDDFILDFKNIRIMFQHPWFTLVPASLFDESEARAYFEMKFSLDENSKLLNQRIADFNAQLIYSVPSFLLDELLVKFEGAKIYHHINALLSSLYYQAFHLNKEVVYVNLSGNIFDIAIIKGNSLKLCNSYACNNPEDVLYFVMHAFQSFNLSAASNECFISGYHENFKTIEDLLRNYILNIHLLRFDTPEAPGIGPCNLFLIQHCV